MGSPRDEVFTTVAVVNGEIEFLDLHLKRLKEHANRLDFEINIPDFQKFEDGLVRITFSGTWNFEIRIPYFPLAFLGKQEPFQFH